MTKPAHHAELLTTLGLKVGDLVQEFGWDEDVDFDVRDALEDSLGEELLTEEEMEPVDAVLLWWRAEDGDIQELGDMLVDARTNLDEGAPIWLMTPKPTRAGHVSPADVHEACESVGLRVCGSEGLSADWGTTRIEHARPN